MNICDRVSPKSFLDLLPATAYNKQCDKVMKGGGREGTKGGREEGRAGGKEGRRERVVFPS